MLFSVLIANYNNGRYVGAAINSVIKQSYSKWEIIIIDDASTDNSIEIIERHQRDGINIKLFRHNMNEGCGATKNDCVRHANGEICGFLDPDDTLAEDALEAMVNEHASHPDASLVYSTYNCCDNDLNFKCASEWVAAVPVNTTNLHVDSISHFVSFKKDRYMQTEGINRKIKSAIDKDLYYKLEEVGAVLFIPRSLYNYRENESGVSQFSNILGAQESHINVIRAAIGRRKKSKYQNLSLFEFNRKYSRMLINMASFLVNSRKQKSVAIKYLVISFLRCPVCHHNIRLRVIRDLIGSGARI